MASDSQSRRLRLLIVNPTIVSKREHLHIGIATVGSYVQAHSHHEVRILDFMAHRRTWRRRLRDEIRDYAPDLVAMYVSSPYFPVAREVAAEIKRLTRVPLVAGGHHPTLAPESILSVPDFDWAIQGEGEIAMLALLDAVASGGPLSEVPGLWRREGGGFVGNPRALLLPPEDFPAIDWTLHDEETLRTNFSVWGILPVMASRGCPAKCSFCSITNIQRLYPGQRFLRFRDPVAVIDEIEADYARFKPLGMRAVYFYDLNFLLNIKWLRAFTDEYRRRGLHRILPWSAYTRPDHMNAAAAECLRDSGCNNLRIGIEAANPSMRNDIYRKNVSQDQLEGALRRVKDLGISVTGYFMAGGPGERPEWLLESLEFAHRFGVEFPVFFLYQPLAGSDILERAAELGSRVREDVGEEAADFLHGVNMEHRHIASWQLSSFVLLTHAVFGARMVQWQVARAGLPWVGQLARYAARTLRIGFSPYGAFTYFVYYGEDHLVEPLKAPLDPKPSPLWRAMRSFAGLLLPHSGEPSPGDGESTAARGAPAIRDKADSEPPASRHRRRTASCAAVSGTRTRRSR